MVYDEFEKTIEAARAGGKILKKYFGGEIARVSVGKEPNGISIWSRESGGTP